MSYARRTLFACLAAAPAVCAAAGWSFTGATNRVAAAVAAAGLQGEEFDSRLPSAVTLGGLCLNSFAPGFFILVR